LQLHINELARTCNTSKSTLIILRPQPRNEDSCTAAHCSELITDGPFGPFHMLDRLYTSRKNVATKFIVHRFCWTDFRFTPIQSFVQQNVRGCSASCTLFRYVNSIVPLWMCACVSVSFITGKTKQNKTSLNIYVSVPHAKVVCCQRSGQNDLCILYFQCATLLKELSCALSAAQCTKPNPYR